MIDPSQSAAVVGTVQSERRFGAVRAARKLYWRQLKGQEWAVRARRPAHRGEGGRAMNHNVKFPLGRLVATPGALRALEEAGQPPLVFLVRPVAGDRGEVGQADWKANDKALQYGERLQSAYTTARGVKFWVRTEADRSCSTLLLPGERKP